MTSVDRLARTLSGLEARMRSMEASPQLGYSSIDDAALKLYIDGLLRGYFGKLPGLPGDGGVPGGGFLPINAPPPPRPGRPTATAVSGGFIVRWDATFVSTPIPGAEEPTEPVEGEEPITVDGEEEADELIVVPHDFTRVEVHVSTENPFVADAFDTLITTIESPRGGEVFVRVLDQQPRYVALVARNTSGTRSMQSEIITVTALPELENTPTNFVGDDPPANPEENWIWWKTPGNKPHIYRNGQWVELTDQAAIDAALLAAQAMTSANGKNRIYYLATAPAGTAHVNDDIWFDTANGYRVSRWSTASQTWVLSELGHQAIGSLDMGKATVGLMNAKHIGTGVLVAGQTIKAGGHTAGGALLATGNRVEMSDLGIKLIRRVAGVDTTTVHLNTGSGSGFFRGIIEADSGYFKGRVEAEEGWFKGDLVGLNMLLAGVLTVTGRLQTDVTGRRVVIDGESYRDSILLYPTTGQPARIATGASLFGDLLEVIGHSNDTTPLPARLSFYPGSSRPVLQTSSDLFLFGNGRRLYFQGTDAYLERSGTSSIGNNVLVAQGFKDMLLHGASVLTSASHPSAGHHTHDENVVDTIYFGGWPEGARSRKADINGFINIDHDHAATGGAHSHPENVVDTIYIRDQSRKADINGWVDMNHTHPYGEITGSAHGHLSGYGYSYVAAIYSGLFGTRYPDSNGWINIDHSHGADHSHPGTDHSHSQYVDSIYFGQFGTRYPDSNGWINIDHTHPAPAHNHTVSGSTSQPVWTGGGANAYDTGGGRGTSISGHVHTSTSHYHTMSFTI